MTDPALPCPTGSKYQASWAQLGTYGKHMRSTSRLGPSVSFRPQLLVNRAQSKFSSSVISMTTLVYTGSLAGGTRTFCPSCFSVSPTFIISLTLLVSGALRRPFICRMWVQVVEDPFRAQNDPVRSIPELIYHRCHILNSDRPCHWQRQWANSTTVLLASNLILHLYRATSNRITRTS